MNQTGKPTVGERLSAAREAVNLSLEDAARATSIKSNFLQELESDHPEAFLSEVQARGFLRLYASFLGLNANELFAIWDEPADSGETEKIAEKDDSSGSLVPGDYSTTEETEEKNIASADEQAEITEKPEKESKPNLLSPLVDKIRQLFSRIPFSEKLKSLASWVKVPVSLPKDQIAESAVPMERSLDIFKEIGAALRDRRLAMDLNLSDIEHFTNLKRMVLIAIEDGRFNDLPSTVQGRGMLFNYAKFLAMNDSAVMDRYSQALQLQREERMPSRKAPQPAVSVKVNLPNGMRRVLNLDLVVGGVLIVAVFGFIIWGATLMLSSKSGQGTAAPSISQMLQVTPSTSPIPDLTLTAEATKSTELATAVPGVIISQTKPTIVPTANAAPLQLYIIAHDRAYMRITVDGVSAFDGRVLPNNVYTFSGNKLISLLTGNGEALEVYFNQKYLGKLGSVGQVVNLSFSPQGLQTPTPLPLATPTPSSASGRASPTPAAK
jgi:cytoskeleton protein RodZ